MFSSTTPEISSTVPKALTLPKRGRNMAIKASSYYCKSTGATGFPVLSNKAVSILKRCLFLERYDTRNSTRCGLPLQAQQVPVRRLAQRSDAGGHTVANTGDQLLSWWPSCTNLLIFCCPLGIVWDCIHNEDFLHRGLYLRHLPWLCGWPCHTVPGHLPMPEPMAPNCSAPTFPWNPISLLFCNSLQQCQNNFSLTWQTWNFISPDLSPWQSSHLSPRVHGPPMLGRGRSQPETPPTTRLSNPAPASPSVDITLIQIATFSLLAVSNKKCEISSNF